MKPAGNNKNILLILCVLSLVALPIANVIYRNSYVPFQPIIFDNDLGYKMIPATKKINEGLPQVLIYYNADFRLENGNVSIKRKLNSDSDLIVNYTTKATDKEWLKEHPIKHGL